MIDSHTHLHSCAPPAEELVEAARRDGVTRIATVGTDAATSRVALATAEQFPEVYAVVGHHPNDATAFSDSELDELEALAGHPRCVAVGETGLDYYRERATQADQERAFLAQIGLARRVEKPLVIHTRAADDDTLKTLREHAAGLKVILHCFSMADRIVECLEQPDWWFSFAGNVTYPKAADLREAALRVPDDRLLVETDAPYLSPQPVRGKPNEPANVVRTAELLALERRVSYDEFERGVESAAAAVYGW